MTDWFEFAVNVLILIIAFLAAFGVIYVLSSL